MNQRAIELICNDCGKNFIYRVNESKASYPNTCLNCYKKLKEEQAMTEVVINRQVKDRVFTLLFSTKEAQLELYNAMNGTNYTDYEALEVTTLEAALYMGMKNALCCTME